jgi:hypothetical protein
MTVGGSREALSAGFARKIGFRGPVEAVASGASGAGFSFPVSNRAAMGTHEQPRFASCGLARLPDSFGTHLGAR